MMSDAGMRPVAMNRPRGVTAGAIVRAQPVTETSLMESGTYIVTRYLDNPKLLAYQNCKISSIGTSNVFII
jgi:hypothetical protein